MTPFAGSAKYRPKLLPTGLSLGFPRLDDLCCRDINLFFNLLIQHLAIFAIVPPRPHHTSGHLVLTEVVAGGHLVTNTVASVAVLCSRLLDDLRFGGAVIPRGGCVTPEVALSSTCARLPASFIISVFKQTILKKTGQTFTSAIIMRLMDKRHQSIIFTKTEEFFVLFANGFCK